MPWSVPLLAQIENGSYLHVSWQTSCWDSAAFTQHITPRDDTWETELILIPPRDDMWDTTDDVRVSNLDLMLLPAPSSSAASASPTDSTAVTFPDPTALLASNLSESQTVIHHYVQQMGGFMWVSVYWCTSPHDSTMPSQPLCFMPRWCGWWLALWRLRIHLWLLSCCVWLRNLYLFLTEFVSHYSLDRNLFPREFVFHYSRQLYDC